MVFACHIVPSRRQRTERRAAQDDRLTAEFDQIVQIAEATGELPRGRLRPELQSSVTQMSGNPVPILLLLMLERKELRGIDHAWISGSRAQIRSEAALTRCARELPCGRFFQSRQS